MIKVGIIGHGFSAKTFHIPLIQSSDVVVLAAISSSRPAAVQQAHPDITVFESADALITSGHVDLIVITAPNEAHYSLAKQCLDNNLHVVLEKPMVTTHREAQDLISIANSRSLVLSVFHNRRWDGDFLTVKKLLDQQRVGDLRFFESHFDRFRPNVRQRWREQPGQGTGIWFDLGSHLIDQALSLFGMPNSITARCLPLRDDSQATDYFHVQLHYPKLEVVLHGSPFSAAPNMRFKLEGTKGSYIKYGLDPQEEHLKAGLTPINRSFGVEEPAHYGSLYSETATEVIKTEDGCYQHYYTEIAAAITAGGDNPVNPEDAANVMTLLELAEDSSASGKTVEVSL